MDFVFAVYLVSNIVRYLTDSVSVSKQHSTIVECVHLHFLKTN